MVHRMAGAIVERYTADSCASENKKISLLPTVVQPPRRAVDNVGILCMMIHFSGVLIGKATDKFYLWKKEGKIYGFCAEKFFAIFIPLCTG